MEGRVRGWSGSRRSSDEDSHRSMPPIDRSDVEGEGNYNNNNNNSNNKSDVNDSEIGRRANRSNPNGVPHTLRDLRTDSTSNFSFLLNKPSALDEQRIQRIIEDKLLLESETATTSSSAHIPTLPTPKSNNSNDDNNNNIPPPVFSFPDLLPFIRHGIDVIIQDDFSRCFISSHSPPWNWNFYLYPLWCLGVIVRYGILFPIRLITLLSGFLLFTLFTLLIKTFVRNIEHRSHWERKSIRFLASIFVFSWTGVIRYHGHLPHHVPNRIYVANHTSLIDMIILSQHTTFSMVGQAQKGFVGFFQFHVLACLKNCWFDRAEATDRMKAAERIKNHIKDPHNNRLLIFPEGTCVNNEYIVQFKQGAFDMGADIVPIAIKYNKIFVDAFWNSRAQSFPMHLLTLMSSWAVVCDVHYLPVMRRRENESAIEFSERVKKAIAEKAGLKNVNWDGYLKHFRPSARYINEQQARVAAKMLRKWTAQGGKLFEEDKELLAARDEEIKDQQKNEQIKSKTKIKNLEKVEENEKEEKLEPPAETQLTKSKETNGGANLSEGDEHETGEEKEAETGDDLNTANRRRRKG